MDHRTIVSFFTCQLVWVNRYTDTAEFLYKTTNYYAPSSDRGIKWNDDSIAIEWPALDCDIITSAKDSVAKSLLDADLFI